MSNYQIRIINPYGNLLFLLSGMTNRGVAQLVAYYVRDVGAGSSSLLTPTFNGSLSSSYKYFELILNQKIKNLSEMAGFF